MMRYGWRVAPHGAGAFGGHHWLAGILMAVALAALIIAVVLLVVYLVKRSHRYEAAAAAGVAGGPYGHDEALAILKMRYARGEIDKAEFEQKKTDLGG